MKSPSVYQAAANALAIALLTPLALGQVAPANPPTATASAVPDETVTLSPFIISTERETGWSANETLSATRTKQALKDVPVNIDAITADFMEDLGLHTADEVANFVANAYAPPTLENDSQSGAIAFRGLSGSTASRNYFRWYIPSDTYNVERIDFGKGSNSLIFGDVEPGGQASVFTKRALMKNFGSFTGIYTSDGAYRLMLDYNRKLREGLAARLNIVRRVERTLQDASDFKLEGETLTFTWQPLRHTRIRVDLEQGNFDNVRGFAGLSIRERSGRSRSFTTSGMTYTSDGEWIDRRLLPSADRSNGPDGGTPSLIEGSYFDVTMRNAAGAVIGTKRFHGFPKHYNLRGSFDRQGRPFDTYTVTVEQSLGNFGFEFAFNHQNQMALRTDSFFSSTIGVDVNGRPYIDTTLDMKRFGNDVDAFRATSVYKFDKWKWMQQLFVLSGEYREDAADNYRWSYFNIRPIERGRATTIDETNDRGRLRAYLDDPSFYSRAFFDRLKPAALPVTNEVNMVPLGWFPSGTSATDGTAWRQAAAVAFSASGRYFNGRVQTLVGARRDWNRSYEYEGTRKFGPYSEDIFPPKKEDALPGEYVQNMQLRLENTSYTGGLTVQLNRDLNFYAVYSESFRFQGLRTFDRERFPPITGVTKEVGLKGSFWHDKANVNLGIFNIDRQNVALTWNNIFNNFSREDLEDLMNPNDVRPGDPRYKYSEEGTGSASRYYKSTENSQGADLTLNLRPVRGLQLRFTVGRAKVMGQPDLDSFRAYYDAAVQRGNENPAILSEAKTLLDTLDIDTKPAGIRASPWSASWVIDYAFPRDAWTPLRGVRLGFNGSWRDSYLIGISNGQEMIGSPRHLVSGYIFRDQKIWNQMVRFRLGARNILDLESSKVRKTAFTTMLDGTNVYRYSYVEPVQFELNATVRF